MCGVAGIFDLKGKRDVDFQALTRMTNALAHRGPDGEGFFTSPGVGLGHRRLAVIDLQGGDQPFHAAEEAGVLSTNGEIYNYQALATNLAAKGVSFRTRSDTEVLAEGLVRHSDGFIEQLRGMFAFAWWDGRQQSLLLARDRLGERPLYYAETSDGFLIFASEVTAIAASGLMPLELCPQAICDYFHLGYVPDPKSIYRGVKKLPPGAMLTAHAGETPRLTHYWRPQFDPDPSLSFGEASEQLLERLDEAVRLQLMSDVPLGAFLSGGLDSSAIVAAMAQSTDHIKSCSIGFEEDSHDERDFARMVAQQYETDHCEEVAGLNAVEDIDKVARSFGEPFADTSALPTYAVCRLARKHVTVALSGDGGDEIFAGYRRYPFFIAEEKIRSRAPLELRRATVGALGAAYPKLDWAPKPLRFKTTLQSLGDSRAEAYLRSVGANLPDRAMAMLSNDFVDSLDGYSSSTVMEAAFDSADSDHPLLAAQQVDLATWLPGRMLTKVDRASMAHSLEVRPPLLDHKLVEWAGGLDPTFKLGRTRHGTNAGKRVLKTAHESRLSENILYRRKQGFGLPIATWLRDKNGPLNRLQQSTAWQESGILCDQEIAKMTQKHQTGRTDYSQELWTVIMFDAFLRNGAGVLKP